MPDVNVAVRLGGPPRVHAAVILPGRDVLDDRLSYEIDVLSIRFSTHSICPIRIQPPTCLSLVESLQRLFRYNHSTRADAASAGEMRGRRRSARLIGTIRLRRRVDW